MLISLPEAAARVNTSRRTLNRRLKEGVLTRHEESDGAVLVDTRELDELFLGARQDVSDHMVASVADAAAAPTRTRAAGATRQPQLEMPHPDDVEAAAERAMHPPLLPFLFRRRQRRQ